MTVFERLHRTGFLRLGDKKRGFRYVRAAGGRPSATDLERIRALAIPPAWRDVAIHASARGSVQAVGRDAAGRWQYRYHPARAARGEKKKYTRLVRFGEALPKMRRAVARDLARTGLPREKVLAVMLRVLAACFLRPGSRVYAERHGSYGIATLRREHITVSGDLVTLNFPGKSGKRQKRQMRDREVARAVKRLTRTPGKVFRYRDAEGRWIDIRRRHINEYIREVMGSSFSAKDFRTWAATLMCACILAREQLPPSDRKTNRRRKAVAAVAETAARLGNTPAIARASYIAPRILKDFDRGRLVVRRVPSVRKLVARRSPPLHEAEKALVARLKEDGGAR